MANKSDGDWYEREKHHHRLHFILLALNNHNSVGRKWKKWKKIKRLRVQSGRKIYYSKQKLAFKNWRDEKLKNWINEESTLESARKTFYHNHISTYWGTEESRFESARKTFSGLCQIPLSLLQHSFLVDPITNGCKHGFLWENLPELSALKKLSLWSLFYWPRDLGED